MEQRGYDGLDYYLVLFGGIFLFFTYVIWGVLCLVYIIFGVKEQGYISLYDVLRLSIIPVLNMYYVREECEWFDMSGIIEAPLFDWR